MRVEEKDLVERAQDGDSGAFEQLYRDNVDRIYGLCLRMVGDVNRAQEITQDVFVRAWHKLETFQGRSAFPSWLHRLAVNVVLGAERKRRRSLRLFVNETPEAVEPRDTENAAQPDVTLDLERALLTLSPQARLVFVLHEVQGHHHKEISTMTGMAEGTSKAHLHRARRLLKEALQR